MSLKRELMSIDHEIIPHVVRSFEKRYTGLSEAPTDEFLDEMDRRELDYEALFAIVFNVGFEIATDIPAEHRDNFMKGASRVVEILIEIAEIQEMPTID